MSNLQQKYRQEVAPSMKKELGLKNAMTVPSLSKIVVSMGVRDALSEKKSVEKMSDILSQITGQKPKVTKAKKSIASFKLREGDAIGLMVTLRGKRMYDFFEKLVGIVLPRLRDFHGVRRNGFDGHGNYSFGLSEFTVFPEIDPGKIERVQGLQISIITTANTNDAGTFFLEKLGMPFEKTRAKS